MIGKLSGRIDYRGDDHVLIDVQGVGYIVYCSDRTMASLPRAGEFTSLYTDLLVREDVLQLFGFTTLVEKEWHRLLMTVQGVGAKASLAILGALGPDGVGRAIALGDWNAVKAAKGIGPKTAQKVVIDLKDKAPSVMAMGGKISLSEPTDVIEPASPAPKRKKADDGMVQAAAVQADALSALTNLGYTPSDATSAVAQAMGEDPSLDMSGLIKAALKLLAPKG